MKRKKRENLNFSMNLIRMIEAEVDVSVVLWMFVDAHLQGLPVNDAL